MTLMSGTEVREEKLKELKRKLENLSAHPGLAVIQVGSDEASNVYINQKKKLAESLNYNFKHLQFDKNIKEEDLINEINKLNNDVSVDGIIVQMPISKHLNESKIQNSILHEKDVDGLTYLNEGRLVHNDASLVPCTPKGIMELLDYYGVEIEGKNAVVIARSILVGKPVSSLLLNRNATVTICHSKTENLEYYTKNADILVVAVGKKHFLDGSMIKEGCTVIDVGINREGGKLYGDVDFESAKEKCAFITPVPGGVGPMTVYELMEQTYISHTLKRTK